MLPAHFSLLVDGISAFNTLFERLEKAERSIYVEMFIFSDDKTGWDMALILAKKAREGLDVRVMYDQIGTYYFSFYSWRAITGRLALLRFLKTQGVKIIHAGEPNPFHFQLDHRKIIVIDSKEAFTGGMNIGDHYQFEWHDIFIHIKEPEIAHGFERIFLREWMEDVPKSEDIIWNENTYSMLITDFKINDIEEDLNRRIRTAKKNVFIEVPYITDIRLIRALIDAKKRGVDVKVIIPKVSNHLITRLQHAVTVKWMRFFDVDIFIYGKTLNHLKVYLIDDEYVSLGSANATYRSMKRNKEFNLGTNDKKIVDTVKEYLFERDFKRSIRMKSIWESAG